MVPSALVFLVHLFIQLLGLKVLQTVRSATHDFIWGFHKPLEEEMGESRDYIFLKFVPTLNSQLKAEAPSPQIAGELLNPATNANLLERGALSLTA